VKVAKVLGGSFKLVTLVPRTVREITQLPKHKPRLNMHTQINILGPTGLYNMNWSW